MHFIRGHLFLYTFMVDGSAKKHWSLVKALPKTLNKDNNGFQTSFSKLCNFPLQSFGLELPGSKLRKTPPN